MKRNIGFWVLCLALQSLLALGLVTFWVYEGKSIQDPPSRASEETIALKLKSLTEQNARAIIGSQQIRIEGLVHERNTAHQFVGYMAALSVGTLVLTLLLMGLSLTQDQKVAPESMNPAESKGPSSNKS